MKKTAALLLALTFASSAVGFTVAETYCRLAYEKSCRSGGCCDHCLPDCCETVVKVFKLDYESLLGNKTQLIATALPPVPVFLSPVLSSEAPAAGRPRPGAAPRHGPSLPFLQTFLI
jgi:hypothetical protein